MTQRVKALLELLQSREYRKNRVNNNLSLDREVTGLDRYHRDALRFQAMLAHEQPVLFEGERMGFHRCANDIPSYTDPETGKKSRWGFGNLTPDYDSVISIGMDAVLEKIRRGKRELPAERASFLDALEITVTAALELADRYREAARESLRSCTGRCAVFRIRGRRISTRHAYLCSLSFSRCAATPIHI